MLSAIRAPLGCGFVSVCKSTTWLETTKGALNVEDGRIETLRRMLQKNPGDSRAHFGLAAEYEKLGDWPNVVDHLNQYLAAYDDQGNAWGRLGNALRQLGRDDDARTAYQR